MYRGKDTQVCAARSPLKTFMVREQCPTPGIGTCAEWCGTHCGPVCCRSASWLARKACSTQLAHAGRFSCHALNGMAHLRPLEGMANRHVMIWQGERNADGRLAHMYWPVVGTILAGFLHAANVAVVVGLGFSVDYHRELDSLQRGDTLIWVGAVGKNSQPWRPLRARGVRTVFYQTCAPNLSLERLYAHIRNSALRPTRYWMSAGNPGICGPRENGASSSTAQSARCGTSPSPISTVAHRRCGHRGCAIFRLATSGDQAFG